MPDVLVQSFSHLSDRPHGDIALALLHRVASLLKPIMRKHGWVLPLLSEFFPESPNILGLNLNAGQQILVRLRPPHAPDTFYDEEDVVETMLHELAHNVHGPHDEKFYSFLSGLEQEYEALRKSGYSGEGFHAPGQRLGAGVSHDLPPHVARQRAAEAAEKRRQISAILGGGGRLGGLGRRSSKSLRELAAEAAERRARDDKACASGAVAQAEADKAAKESVRDDVIDLTADDSDIETSPEPEIIIVDEQPAASSSSSSSASTSVAPTPPVRPGPRPTLTGESSSGTYSPASSSTSASPGTRSPASWSGLRPGSSNPSSSSLVSLASQPSSSSASSSAHSTIRPTVRRVERGAGPGTPKLPKPRSLSRPAPAAAAAGHHTVARGTPLRSPATPPPTRTNSVAVVPRHRGDDRAGAGGVPPAREWACPRCTLVNDALALQCAACELLRPAGADLRTEEEKAVGAGAGAGAGCGWTCRVCGERGMAHDFWTCTFCGSVKLRS